MQEKQFSENGKMSEAFIVSYTSPIGHVEYYKVII